MLTLSSVAHIANRSAAAVIVRARQTTAREKDTEDANLPVEHRLELEAWIHLIQKMLDLQHFERIAFAYARLTEVETSKHSGHILKTAPPTMDGVTQIS